MELSSLETSCDSVLAKGFDSSGSTSLRPACDEREASDAAFEHPTEERSLQISTRQPWSKREHLNSPEESSSKGNASPCFSFMKKLWDIVESSRFESIWWGDNGKCVVIHEELFKEEVLARRGRLRIFESETMKSFSWQLHRYGFTKRLWNFPKLGSRIDLLAEETTGEFHFYYNPNFRRHFPYLLMKYKQSFGPKNQTPESGPFTAGPRENVHTSAPRKTAPAKRRASTSARSAALTRADPAAAVGREELNPLAPSLFPQHSSPGPAAASAAASWGCAVPAVPNSPFPPGLAPLTSPAGLAAAAALSMPRPPQGQTPPDHRCLTCTCGTNSRPAGDGLGPQPRAR
uniref:HSF-type DNA-binding domain-containing protein n=1 Tax=Aquila chrysaetos chrysaetos TaxID=223781 RepID=A0A663FCZ3_AQUCH